jgi:hypothetical protein
LLVLVMCMLVVIWLVCVSSRSLRSVLTLLHHLLLMLLLLLLLSEDHGLGDGVGLGHEFWVPEDGLAHGMWVDISARGQERICTDLANPVTLMLGEGQLQRVRV